ncbi:agamous-like MADS-box protein AGL62 [Actinidia eriantha]|uniref:agamous-like MADS-box protein AGL62 n=1 Tax=Actinidia eriantha TaxID=165200 RepID=UPI00258CB8CA|nr:agamous-like MADS-box protein AGL62 [Actinidia eriantha]
MFRKAREISTLNGADGAVILFTLEEKNYAFKNPRVESVFDKFLFESPPSNNLEEMLMKQVSELEEFVEAEKRRGEELKKAIEVDNESHHLLRVPMEELRVEELGQLKAVDMEEMRGKWTREWMSS